MFVVLLNRTNQKKNREKEMTTIMKLIYVFFHTRVDTKLLKKSHTLSTTLAKY